jgi:hypothetical protein
VRPLGLEAQNESSQLSRVTVGAYLDRFQSGGLPSTCLPERLNAITVCSTMRAVTLAAGNSRSLGRQTSRLFMHTCLDQDWRPERSVTYTGSSFKPSGKPILAHPGRRREREASTGAGP